MSGDQIAVVVLIVAAFLAGWYVRGIRPGPGEQTPRQDPLLPEVDGLLDRAVEASRTALDSPGAPSSSLGELKASVAELERIDGRLEALLGEGAPAYESFETVLNELTALARSLAAPHRIGASADSALQARASAARRARGEYARRLS